MNKIIDKRGTGKSSRLILLAKKNNGVLVCNNPAHMILLADSYGIHGLKIISYEDFIEKGYQRDKDREIYIDDIDCFLKYTFGNNLAGYSATLEGI